MCVKAAIGGTASLTVALVWIDDTVKNLLSLVDSLEDEPCEHVPSRQLTEIGSGNNHWQQ